MFYELFHDLLNREPFEPFRVYLKDCRVFDVRFPRTNSLGRYHITIGTPLPDDPHPVMPLCGSSEMVEFWQIDRVEMMPVSTAATQG